MIQTLFLKKNETLKILASFLRMNNLKISDSNVKDLLETNKSYPTLRSISDTLDLLGIKNFSIVAEISDLGHLARPVISIIRKGDEEKYIVIKSISNDSVCYWDGQNTFQAVEEFTKDWTNIVLIISVDENQCAEINTAHHKSYIADKVSNSFDAILFTLIASFLFIVIKDYSHIKSLLFLAINFMGVSVSLLLLRKENKEQDSSIDKFCKVGKYVDCDSVLNYKVPLLLGRFSWAQIGLSFFVYQITLSLLYPTADYLSFVIAACSLPFSFYSIGVQVFQVRKLCIFCCLVIVLLWVSFFLQLPLNSDSILFVKSLNICELIQLPIIALMILQVVHLWDNKNKTHKKYLLERRKFNHFKYDKDLIEKLNGEQIRFPPNENFGVSLSNNQSETNITIFLSFSCTFCSIAFQKVVEIAKLYSEYNYTIVFKIDGAADKTNIEITRRILHEFWTGDEKYNIVAILNRWYAKNSQFDSIENTMLNEDIDDIIEKCIKFKEVTNISYTPALFINGKAVSKLYNFDDWEVLVSQLG